MKNPDRVICLLAFMILVVPIAARASKGGSKTQAICYMDTRDYATINIKTSTSNLPWGLSIWGFTDFHGNQHSEYGRFDITRYFAEYRLIWGVNPGWIGGISGFGLHIEGNDRSGPGNSVGRFGLAYKQQLAPVWGRGGWILLRGCPVETDNSGGQATLSYFIPLFGRFSISGFNDWNLNNNGPNRWVCEQQLNVLLYECFRMHVEFRYSGIEEASPYLDGKGVALGIGVVF